MSHHVKEREEDDFSFNCPSCRSGVIKIQKTIYDSHDGDQILILKYECSDCGYISKDVVPVSSKMKPGIISMKINKENDLKSKLYRAPTAKIEIPEFELVMEPGPNADFYFTNVEGVLRRFESAVKIYRNNLQKDDPQIPEIDFIILNLQKALEGKFPFTLKITDLSGGSYIVPQEDTPYEFEPKNIEASNNEKDFHIS
ncbi:MAG: ZPR1 zinc finger domain-containing protein [Candidatus Lokiarchaeota archaeon]|nr:ZPR1 zinc finger domain-containing protein [Candidatus Lokiarchaeota archaeon]